MSISWGLPDWRNDTTTSLPGTRDDQPAPDHGGCPCGMHDDTPEPGKEALLSCAPGVVSRMWRVRVGNGQWEDTESAWDAAHANTHLPALNEQRRIHGDLAARRHDIRTALTQNPALMADGTLRDGLHDLETQLAGRLADMQAEAAAKEAAA